MSDQLGKEQHIGSRQIVDRSISALRPYARNARTHSKKQLRQIAASIERFGFVNPVLVAGAGNIIAGHGRVEAAKILGLKTVPTLAVDHLSEVERRAYILADNKLALNAGWDKEILAIELQGLIDLEFQVDLTGFSLAEIDGVLDDAREGSVGGTDESDDVVPTVAGPAVTLTGDCWIWGTIAWCAATLGTRTCSRDCWVKNGPTSCSPIRRTT